MLNDTFCPVVDSGWVPSATWRNVDSLKQREQMRKSAPFLDEIPVMSSTVLGLDILLNEPYLDLQMASEIILSDVGATIHVLRLVSREYRIAAERPSRMGDCIASLDVSAWFAAISARTFVGDQEHSATTALWKHSRLIAQYAQLVAESLDDISPEDAYMVGLLHGIEAIPAALGGSQDDPASQHEDVLSAVEGALPPFVLEAIRSMNDSSRSSVWRCVLTAAHELAGTRTDFDASALHSLNPVVIASHP